MTYSLLYFSLYIHRANRNVQKTLLSQQATLLNSVVDPLPPLPDPPAYELRKAGLAEQLKDGWNREVEKLVHTAQTTDWAEKREVYERRIVAAWNKIRSSEPAQELEQKVKETVAQGTEIAKGATSKAKEEVERKPRLLELK